MCFTEMYIALCTHSVDICGPLEVLVLDGAVLISSSKICSTYKCFWSLKKYGRGHPGGFQPFNGQTRLTGVDPLSLICRGRSVGVLMGRSEPPVPHDNGSFLHDLHQRQNKLLLFKPIVHLGLEPNMRQVCIDMEHIQ